MKTSDLRIAFFGTPELAVYVLEELGEANIIPALIVTPPDRPAGSKLEPTPPPVKIWAIENDIEYIQSSSLKEPGGLELLTMCDWDVFIVAAYSFLMPDWVLKIPQHGVLNVHPSLLPKLRGPSPVRTAIRDDLKDEVGVSIIELDEQVDHGPIVAQARIELPVWPEKGHVLDEILFREGGRLLVEVLPKWIHGEIKPEEQKHEEATMSHKFIKAEGEIKLGDNPYKNYLKFCAHDGWPGTFFFQDCNGRRMRVKVTEAEYVNGRFNILRVIPEGRHEIKFEEWEQTCEAT